MDDEKLEDVRATAQRLGVTESAVRKWILDRTLPFYKVGAAVRLSPVEVDRWLAARRVAARDETRAEPSAAT